MSDARFHTTGHPMAIWQVTFYLVPRAAIEKLDGTSALVIGAFRPVDFDSYDENAEHPNCWEGHSPKVARRRHSGVVATEHVVERRSAYVWRRAGGRDRVVERRLPRSSGYSSVQ